MSMDNRKPMKDVAEAIILAHQVGQGSGRSISDTDSAHDRRL